MSIPVVLIGAGAALAGLIAGGVGVGAYMDNENKKLRQQIEKLELAISELNRQIDEKNKELIAFKKWTFDKLFHFFKYMRLEKEAQLQLEELAVEKYFTLAQRDKLKQELSA